MGVLEAGNVPWMDYGTGGLNGNEGHEFAKGWGKPEIMRFFIFEIIFF